MALVGAQFDHVKAVAVIVTPINDAPVVANATFNAEQAGSPIFITLTGSDVDMGDSVQSFLITSLPTQGTLQLNGVGIASGSSVSAADIAAGKLTYLPNSSFDSEHGAPAPSFQFKAYDGDSYSNTATATINVADAKPNAVDDTVTMIEGTEPATANLVIMFDTSTSMDRANLGGVVALPGGGTTTRLALAQEAVENLINSYGDSLQKVMLVTFNNGAAFRGWLTPAAAITMINNLTTANGTDYDSALSTVQDWYGTPDEVDHTYAYFLSDGSPVNSFGSQATSASVSQGERESWVDFLIDKGIDAAYAVGIGADVTSDSAKSNLDTVAWSPVASDNPTLTWTNSNNYVAAQPNHNTNTIVVSAPLQLESVLEGTVQEFNGGLLDGSISGNIADDFGADGAAALKIVNVTLDTNGDGVGDVNATLSGTTYSLNLGATIGTLTIDATTGGYSFNPAADFDIKNDTTFDILYTIEDGDGSRDTATLSLTLQDRSEVNAYDNYAQAVVAEVLVTGKSDAPITIASNFTMIDNNNGGASSTTRTFEVASGNSADLSIRVDTDTRTNDGNNRYFNTGDTFTWQLLNTSTNATQQGEMNVDGIISIQNLAAGNYQLTFILSDNTGGSRAAVALSDLRLTSTPLDRTEVQASLISGNVITDANTLVGSTHAWGATDSLGSEGAILSAINDTDFNNSTTITDAYGSLTINSTGQYTYTPTANLNNVNHSQTFHYTLTQPDGDTTTAKLVIDIVGSTATPNVVTSVNGIANGAGNDDVILGNSSADTLTGNGGNDHLEGKAGNDTLYGNADNDILIGGEGDDILYGGAGADTFVWLAGHTGADTVKDFTLSGAERDTIDLRDLLQGENDANIDNFIRLVTTDSATTLEISSKGEFAQGAAADVTIQLDGINAANINPGNLIQSDLINSLIAGGDLAMIKVDHT